MSAPILLFDEDNSHFYQCHPEVDMTVAGLERLVDGYADAMAGRPGGLVFCANVQRALFDSKVWEPLWRDYDPQGGDDQPCLMHLSPAGRRFAPGSHRNWVHHLQLLAARGIDHLGTWLARSRARGLEAWLSMRMNDCHHNPAPAAFWHPDFWRRHPETHRAAHRDEGWFETAYDYAAPGVVEHHLALLRELTERFDADGLLLDWVRWVHHFRPGHERRGAGILTAVMREARRLIRLQAERLGRPVRLGVRLPADLAAADALGYDVATWAAEDLVDDVILAPFFEQAAFDWRIGLWRAVLGPQVRIHCQPERTQRAFPAAGERGKVSDHRLLYGGAASALQRGTDGIYLFNECYREGNPGCPVNRAFPGQLAELLRGAADPAWLAERPRRHSVSYHQIQAYGSPAGTPLPVRLSRAPDHWEFARYRDCIPLSIPLGPVPRSAPVRLLIGLSEEAAALAEGDFTLWINSRPGAVACQAGAAPRGGLPPVAVKVLAWELARELLHDDSNLIELLPPNRPGAIVWAELAVG